MDGQAQETPSLFHSVTFRAGVIGLLILLLLIPLAMVQGLVGEREATREQARAEVAEKWGGPQDLGGPVLVVPYRYSTKDDKGRITIHTSTASFLPSRLNIVGEIRPEIRYRGIFEVPLYNVVLSWTGDFKQPDFTPWKIPPADVLWEDARLLVGIPDMRGIKEDIELSWNDGTARFEPGTEGDSLFPSGIHAAVPALRSSRQNTFAFRVNLNGSRHLTFLPLGEETRAKLSSSWPDPSFAGKFLPETREIRPGGFTAEWRVFYLARPYPQQWKDNTLAPDAVRAWAGGVELFRSVDAYQKTTRSAKYGVLFLFLTFAVYFLFEILSHLKIHAFQYLLVGFALSLFYLLLLSFSEHVGFGASYLIASAATVGLVTAYSASVLGGTRRAGGTATALSGLYGYLYILLQLEDYALLLGAVGLFAILATVMWVTRKIDWYTVSS